MTLLHVHNEYRTPWERVNKQSTWPETNVSTFYIFPYFFTIILQHGFEIEFCFNAVSCFLNNYPSCYLVWLEFLKQMYLDDRGWSLTGGEEMWDVFC